LENTLAELKGEQLVEKMRWEEDSGEVVGRLRKEGGEMKVGSERPDKERSNKFCCQGMTRSEATIYEQRFALLTNYSFLVAPYWVFEHGRSATFAPRIAPLLVLHILFSLFNTNTQNRQPSLN